MVCQAERCAAPCCAFSCGMPADRGRIEEDRRAAQRGEARALGIPLVPADERADPPGLRVEGLEAEVAGREVELLVEERVVGDVHLAVEARDRRRRRRGSPRCCGRGRARAARRWEPRRRPRAPWPPGPGPRCSGPGRARPGRRARRPPSGRSRASGRARAGRRPRPRRAAASRHAGHRLLDVLSRLARHGHLHEPDPECRLGRHHLCVLVASLPDRTASLTPAGRSQAVISRHDFQSASSASGSRNRQRRSCLSIQKRPLRPWTSGAAASQAAVSAPWSGFRAQSFA